MKRIPRILVSLGLMAALSGCVSNLPKELQEPPANAVGVESARRQANIQMGDRVRWGGEIVAVTNKAQETLVEVVDRPLDATLRPVAGLPGGGRFLARVPGFLDPQDYAAGRLITVAGRFDGLREGRVGEYAYQFPQVEVDSHYLWSIQRPMPRYYYDPFWDPFWDPWPHHHWRYHHHPHHW